MNETGTAGVRAAIDRYFADTRRTKQETLDGLIVIRDHIEPLIDMLETEIEMEAGE